MPWFAAHTITYFRFKDGQGGDIPVWENVILVEAGNRGMAAQEAEKLAHDGEGSFGGLATMHGRPGEVVFAGVRKVQLVGDAKPGDGEEVSYVELTVSDLASVRALASGESVSVVCDRVIDERP